VVAGRGLWAEPLNNLGSVARAVGALTDDAAFGFSKRHVLVSTVGPSPALRVAVPSKWL